MGPLRPSGWLNGRPVRSPVVMAVCILMTTVERCPSLSGMAVMAGQSREVMAMETARKQSPADEHAIVDVRSVPLEQLSADAAALRLVSAVMRSVQGSSRVTVSAFGSAI